MAPEVTGAIGSWLLLLPAAFLLGRRFRPLVHADHEVLNGVLSCALGMAVLSYSVVVLSALKILRPAAIWVVLAVIVLTQFGSLRSFFSWLKAAARNVVEVKTLPERILSFVFILSFLGLLFGTLTPEIGGDALAYQLNMPKRFLARGSIAPEYYDVNTYFPLLLNHLYLIGLATGGVMSAKLFHFFCGLLLFLAVKEIVSRETENPVVGYFSALAVWLTPAFYNMASTTYVDVGLTLYVFLSLATLVFAFGSGALRVFFLSGLLIGCALAIKYLALLSVVALGGLWCFELMRRRLGIGFLARGFVAWTGGAFLSAGYVFVRNAVLTGNPVFPYFGNLFGTEPLDVPGAAAFGMGKSIASLITVFWNLFFNSLRFGEFSDRIGVCYLLFFPFLILSAAVAPRARHYIVFSIVFVLLWFHLRQVSRYLVPVLPAITVAAAHGISWTSGRIGSMLRRSVGAAGFLVLAVYLAGGIYHYRFAFLFTFGFWNAEEYLLRMERTIPIARWINEHLPEDAKVLIESEPRQFYLDREVIRDAGLDYRTRYQGKEWDPPDFSNFLKAHEITHLLLRDPLTEPEENSGPLRALAAGDAVRRLKSAPSENLRDARYRYHLYALK